LLFTRRPDLQDYIDLREDFQFDPLWSKLRRATSWKLLEESGPRRIRVPQWKRLVARQGSEEWVRGGREFISDRC